MAIDEDEEEGEEDAVMDAAQRKSVAASKGVAAALHGQPTIAASADASGARYGLGGGAMDEMMDQGGMRSCDTHSPLC